MNYKDQARAEMDALENYLKKHEIPYEREERFSKMVTPENRRFAKEFQRKYPDFDYGEQIWVFDETGEQKWDVIYGTGSYGYEDGLLEGMGEIFANNDDNVWGYLSAQKIINLIEEAENENR